MHPAGTTRRAAAVGACLTMRLAERRMGKRQARSMRASPPPLPHTHTPPPTTQPNRSERCSVPRRCLKGGPTGPEASRTTVSSRLSLGLAATSMRAPGSVAARVLNTQVLSVYTIPFLSGSRIEVHRPSKFFSQ
eukprot:353093-Chlamydomonas_euryale.AAC.5